MRLIELNVAALTLLVLIPALSQAQAVNYPGAPTPPTLAETRAAMGIPSKDDLRGQLDTVGFASTAAQMEKVWELSGDPPAPASLGPVPEGVVAGVLCPHDDYLYAGRMYRAVLPLLKARTVVLVGVFHRFRKFGAHDAIVLDSYRAWRAPDGEIPVSPLRDAVLARLPKGDAIADAAMHDSEHSLEALAYWLRHVRPDLEIVPVIVPVMSFERMEELAADFGGALAAEMKARGLALGRDVAFAISSDAVHYGPDFKHVPYGDGGVAAYIAASERDVSLLTGPLAGPVVPTSARAFFETCVDPEDPSQYRLTWCGRYSIPLGLLMLRATSESLGTGTPAGHPIAYATSVGAPELPVREIGLGETAPANLYHFVGYPAAAYTVRGDCSSALPAAKQEHVFRNAR